MQLFTLFDYLGNGSNKRARPMKNLLLGRFIAPLLRPAPPMTGLAVAPDGPATMAAIQREAAMFAAEMMGAQSYARQFGPRAGPIAAGHVGAATLRDLVEGAPQAFMLIDPRPGLHIVDINDAYGAATLTWRGKVAGSRLFDVFPDNPDVPDADGVSNLFQSIQRAAQSGEPHFMAVQRYDVRGPSGCFVERCWQPINVPICDEAGRLAYILHYANEVPGGSAQAL